MSLSKKSKRVQDYLNEFGLDLEVVEFEKSTRTAQEAADAVGCEIGQIVKSLVFKAGEQAVLFLVSGKNRMNTKKVSGELNLEIEMADATFTKEKTGYAIGGVPPIAHELPLETYIDEDLLQYEEIWAAAGMPNSVFKLKSSDLLPLTKGKLISVN